MLVVGDGAEEEVRRGHWRPASLGRASLGHHGDHVSLWTTPLQASGPLGPAWLLLCSGQSIYLLVQRTEGPAQNACVSQKEGSRDPRNTGDDHLWRLPMRTAGPDQPRRNPLFQSHSPGVISAAEHCDTMASSPTPPSPTESVLAGACSALEGTNLNRASPHLCQIMVPER